MALEDKKNPPTIKTDPLPNNSTKKEVYPKMTIFKTSKPTFNERFLIKNPKKQEKHAFLDKSALQLGN